MINFIISSIATTLNLQRYCPHCGRNNGNIHSATRRRRISDIKINYVAQRRMRCPHCGTTWTIRAKGVGDGRRRSDRLISLGVILYMFGLSCRRVADFLPLLDCRGSKSSVERDFSMQAKIEQLEYAAKDMLDFISMLRQKPMPQKIPEAVEKLVRRYSNCRNGLLGKINQLMQHIERTWEKVGGDFGVRTNNATERIIGLDYKIRAKTMRGFKNLRKALNHCYLSEHLRGENGICDLRRVV